MRSEIEYERYLFFLAELTEWLNEVLDQFGFCTNLISLLTDSKMN